MNIPFLLAGSDLTAFRRWFGTGTISKLIVILLFVAVFGVISVVLYRIGLAFFGNLSGFEYYGSLTAGYIIHASIIVILWLAVASSVTSSVGLLLAPGTALDYLFTLPVKQIYIVNWQFIKSAISNCILMSFAFMPIALSYGVAFGLIGPGYVIRSSLVLISLVIFSVSLAMPLALFLVPYVRGKEYRIGIYAMLAFFIVMVLLLKAVFPPELSRLYDASPEQFKEIFPSLMLNRWFMLTLSLTGLLTEGFSVYSLLVLAATGAIAIFSQGIQVRLFWQTIVRVKSSVLRRSIPQASADLFMTVKQPMIYKDCLSIIRDPTETGYAVFLLSVAVFFFAFLRFGTTGNLHISQWKTDLILFAFAWLMFFGSSLYLRFIFPLFSREGKNAAILFSLPVKRSRIIVPKLLFSLVLSVPVILFTGLVLAILPYTSEYRWILMIVCGWTLIVLALVQVLLGAVLPDFREGNNPEKVSTSGVGIVTLIVSIGITTLSGYVIRNILWGGPVFRNIAGMILLDFGLLLLSLLAATKSVKSYRL
jgi:hypothetical protein